MKKILVVAAHSDDEILGCGGTMAKHAKAGDLVSVVFMTDGVSSRESSAREDEDTIKRSSASIRAVEVVGGKIIEQFSFPDNSMDGLARLELIKELEKVVSEYKPDIIYTHHGGDLNIDHRRVLEAVMTSCRPQPWFQPLSIFSFEIPSSTAWQGSSSQSPFIANYYVCIEETLDKKLEALSIYSAEVRDFPHARSIEAVEHLARWRGSQAGFQAAEAFVVERITTKTL